MVRILRNPLASGGAQTPQYHLCNIICVPRSNNISTKKVSFYFYPCILKSLWKLSGWKTSCRVLLENCVEIQILALIFCKIILFFFFFLGGGGGGGKNSPNFGPNFLSSRAWKPVIFIFASFLQIWYVEVQISWIVADCPLNFEITRVDYNYLDIFFSPIILYNPVLSSIL